MTFVNVNQSACETVIEVKVVIYKQFFSRVYICQALSSLFSGFPGRNALFLTGLKLEEGDRTGVEEHTVLG